MNFESLRQDMFSFVSQYCQNKQYKDVFYKRGPINKIVDYFYEIFQGDNPKLDLKEVWRDPSKCVYCDRKMKRKGMCSYHNYHYGDGKQRRKERYLKDKYGSTV